MTLREAAPAWRIGMIVPSSSTTMETEVPELLRRQSQKSGDRFTCHAARLRLKQVTPEALAAMNESAGSGVAALCDAEVDALIYACLVATMFGGKSSVLATEARLTDAANRASAGSPKAPPAIVSSAGALVAALQWLGAKRVSLVTPYRKELTAKVAGAIAEYGIEIVQAHSRGVVDNVAVGRLCTQELVGIAGKLDLSGSDALVLSTCVQMPSLDILDEVEQALGLPVVSAATASAHLLLQRLGIESRIERAGWLLRSPRPPAAPAVLRGSAYGRREGPDCNCSQASLAA